MIGRTPQTLFDWLKRTEVDNGERDGVSTAERERIKALESEVKELLRTNEILKTTGAFHAYGTRPQAEVVRGLRRSIPWAYRRYTARQRNPQLCCARSKRDDYVLRLLLTYLRGASSVGGSAAMTCSSCSKSMERLSR